MDLSRSMRGRSIRAGGAVAAALVVFTAACGPSSTLDAESLGLDVSAQIQAGQQFSLAVPLGDDTTIELVSVPPGVAATLQETADGESIRLTVNVDSNTPRGAYNLGLLAARNGEEAEVAWPFEVSEPGIG